MKRTIEETVNAYRLLLNAKLTNMTDDEKFVVIRLMMAIKPAFTAYEELIKDASQKLRPEGFGEISIKLQSGQGITNEEKKVLDKFNSDIANFMQSEIKKEYEFDAELLEQEAMKRFISSNDFSAMQYMTLYDFMVK